MLSDTISKYRKDSVSQIKKKSHINTDYTIKQQFIDGNIDVDIRYFDSNACNLELKNVVV